MIDGKNVKWALIGAGIVLLVIMPAPVLWTLLKFALAIVIIVILTLWGLALYVKSPK